MRARTEERFSTIESDLSDDYREIEDDEADPEPSETDSEESPEPSSQPEDDGDEIGTPKRSGGILDIVDSGHGFRVFSVDTPKELPTTCEVCGGPILALSQDGIDWLCQYDDDLKTPASIACNCAWCLSYKAYLAGRYRPQGGRPAKRCGSADCKRKAARDRKRKQRGTYTPPATPARTSRKVWIDGTVPRAVRAASEGSGGRW